MTSEEINRRLVEVLVRDFRIDATRVTPDATFRGTLGLDSLDAVDLVYLVCREFELPAELHPFRDLHTVQKVVDHLAAELAKKAAASA